MKLIPKNIPKSLTDNNTFYLSVLLILTISTFTKKYKFLSVYIIIQSLVFFTFSKKDKFNLMLLINILSFVCLIFLLIKSKTNVDEGFRKFKKFKSVRKAAKRAARAAKRAQRAKRATRAAKPATNMISVINNDKKINNKLQNAINKQKNTRVNNQKLLDKKVKIDQNVSNINNRINNLKNKMEKKMKKSDTYESQIRV
jgi:hypothetical protein